MLDVKIDHGGMAASDVSTTDVYRPLPLMRFFFYVVTIKTEICFCHLQRQCDVPVRHFWQARSRADCGKRPILDADAV